jgi:hypothetical protein
MAITWNQSQREIYDLFQQGKTFDQVVKAGYSNSTVSRVQKEFKAKHAPPAVEADPPFNPSTGPHKTGGTTNLIAAKTPVAGLIQLRMGATVIDFLEEDSYQCVQYFRDLQQQLGWQSDFSSTMREAMKLLRAVITTFTPEEVQDDSDRTAR